MNFRLRLAIHCSSVRSSSRPPGELPAQVTRISMAPNRSRVASTQRWTSAVTLMSPASGSTARPVSAAILPAAASSGPAVRAVMTTSQPSRARCSATQRPIPLLAPVTKATFPSSRRSTATPSASLQRYARSACSRRGTYATSLIRPGWEPPPPGGGWMVYQISNWRKVPSAVPQGAERGLHLNSDRADRRQHRGPRGRGGVVAGGQRVAVQESGELPVTVPVVPAPAVQMQPQRRVQVQVVAGPGEGDVEQAVLFGQPARVAQGHVAGQRAVDQVGHVHDGPFQALGGVDGGDGQVVLVQAGWTGQIGAGDRRVQGQFG